MYSCLFYLHKYILCVATNNSLSQTHMNSLVKETLQFRREMLTFRENQDNRDHTWRQSRQEKEDKDRRVMMLVQIDKMSYSDAYNMVYGCR